MELPQQKMIEEMDVDDSASNAYQLRAGTRKCKSTDRTYTFHCDYDLSSGASYFLSGRWCIRILGIST